MNIQFSEVAKEHGTAKAKELFAQAAKITGAGDVGYPGGEIDYSGLKSDDQSKVKALFKVKDEAAAKDETKDGKK